MAKGKIEFSKIDIMSAGKVCAAIHAIMGFVVGLVFASVMGGLLVWMPVMVPSTSQIMNVGVVSGAAGLSAIVIFPIVGAILGFLWGVIAAFLYNLVAMKIGGVVVETK